MQYGVLGLMSGSSLDGLDIVYTELEETGSKWSYEIKAATCIEYNDEWLQKLKAAHHLNAYEYLLLDTAYGKFIAGKINEFIDKNNLYHKVQLIASHGHTVFHAPHLGITVQLGDGATIAAVTGINVVCDLRMMDVALGGEGAPIVPMGEKLLLKEYDYFLNIGGIANISATSSSTAPETYIAFDVCPANRVLNILANKESKPYDDKGKIAKSGSVSNSLLTQLNGFDYYKRAYPKSLANEFGMNTIFPLIESFNISTEDALRTYVEHIAQQIENAVKIINAESSVVNGQWSIRNIESNMLNKRLLVTGGGAFNDFLIERLKDGLKKFNIEVVLPNENLIKYKEALIMALLGVLRWREENTVMNSVTGATRSSIGGAVWMGQEA
jgi:anhydro-N-acetylmuramic acid kinase